MKVLLPVLFATIAALGNAIFALGQKKSANVENGLLFVGLCSFLAFVFAICFAPLMDEFSISNTVKGNWKVACLSGFCLFLTYIGFNLLYSRYGVSQYVLYAVISIITTTIFVGVLRLKEPVNIYHTIAMALAIIAVIMFSLGSLNCRPLRNARKIGK